MSTGAISRIRSRQAGHPSGILGRIIGRAMVKDTSAANDRAIEVLDLDGPSTVMEVGFGQGRTVEVLLRAGHEVLGVDVSPTMVRQATARNRRACRDGRARLVEGGGRMIPFDTGVADAALMVHTVYFMPDPTLTFADIARTLRPGGRLALAARVGDDEVPSWMDPAIYHIPTIAGISAMLGAAGFVNIAHHDPGGDPHATHLFVARLP